MFSIAVTWLALSPSNLPAAVISLTPLALASFSAPSFILTKNGLVSVLVMSPTLMSELLLPPDDEPLELPQAVSARTAAAAAARPAVVRDVADICASPRVGRPLNRGGCDNDAACAIVVMRQRCRHHHATRDINSSVGWKTARSADEFGSVE